ncbi:MAG: hypothetical protein O7E52_03955 [Candidatus Poribacteria bacterium]|nr:hypothetical protein [Candidatus Poribacteria bacterium]
MKTTEREVAAERSLAQAGAIKLRIATVALIGLHFALLLASLPNYRASVDSAYHTALARGKDETGR